MESARRVGLPPAYEDADIDALCQLIALMLDRLISINDRIPLSPESISRFHSASVPQISILDYLRRIVRFTNLEKTCLLLVLHYIDQICAREPTFTISSLTVHRFIISAVSLSSKSHCDAFCTNAHYARVGGLAPAELARLERAFLAAIDWRLACTHEVLQLYYVNLVAHSGGRFYLPSPSSSASSASSTTDPPTTATTTTTTTTMTTPIDTNDPATSTPGSNPGTSADETMFDSPEDGEGSGGVTSSSGSASMGAISPAVMAAAGPPPPSFGGLGTGAPAPSVEQNMAFARFQQRAQGEGS
ncbi:cyclin-domain-containing protein [Lactarius sanguifluus]|nr:cyclin-domain-containing protein [Lactarius sanguifluus]